MADKELSKVMVTRSEQNKLAATPSDGRTGKAQQKKKQDHPGTTNDQFLQTLNMAESDQTNLFLAQLNMNDINSSEGMYQGASLATNEYVEMEIGQDRDETEFLNCSALNQTIVGTHNINNNNSNKNQLDYERGVTDGLALNHTWMSSVENELKYLGSVLREINEKVDGIKGQIDEDRYNTIDSNKNSLDQISLKSSIISIIRYKATNSSGSETLLEIPRGTTHSLMQLEINQLSEACAKINIRTAPEIRRILKGYGIN